MCEELNEKAMEVFRIYKSEGISEKQKKAIYPTVVNDVRNILYFLPKERFGLPEEDCAEYLLFIDGRIDGIIEAYDCKTASFLSFVYPIVERTIRQFKHKKNIANMMEKSVLEADAAYDFMLKEQENPVEDTVVAETDQYYGDDTSFDMKICTVFAFAPRTRIRFFLYFVSYAVDMTEQMVRHYCNSFLFDYEETMKIVGYLTGHYKKRKTEKIENAVELRNRYFGRMIMLENQKANFNFLADHSHDAKIEKEMETIRKKFNIKERYVLNFSRRIPRSKICELFKLSDGSVATYISSSKNIINWCRSNDLAADIPTKKLGICAKAKADITEAVKAGSENYRLLSIFYPVTFFNLETKLNS